MVIKLRSDEGLHDIITSVIKYIHLSRDLVLWFTDEKVIKGPVFIFPTNITTDSVAVDHIRWIRLFHIILDGDVSSFQYRRTRRRSRPWISRSDGLIFTVNIQTRIHFRNVEARDKGAVAHAIGGFSLVHQT